MERKGKSEERDGNRQPCPPQDVHRSTVRPGRKSVPEAGLKAVGSLARHVLYQARFLQFLIGGCLFGVGGFLLANQVMVRSALIVGSSRQGLAWRGLALPWGTPPAWGCLCCRRGLRCAFYSQGDRDVGPIC